MTCLFSISKHHNKTCTYIDIQKTTKNQYGNTKICIYVNSAWRISIFCVNLEFFTHFLLYRVVKTHPEISWLFFQLGTLCKNSLRKLSMTHFNFLRPSWILSSFTTILTTQKCSRKKWLFFQLGTLCIWILP